MCAFERRKTDKSESHSEKLSEFNSQKSQVMSWDKLS